MNDTQAGYALISVLEGIKDNLASVDSVDYEIAQVSVYTVVASSVISNGSAYAGGLLVYEDNGVTHRSVVSSVEGATVTLLHPINRRLNMTAGKMFKLSPGPLKNARIYMGDPPSIMSTIEKDGLEYFITVTCLAGTMSTGSLPGDKRGTSGSWAISYPFTVTAETPYTKSDPNDEEVVRAFDMLPALNGQVLFGILNCAMDQKNRMMLDGGEVAWAYVTWERAGGSLTLRAAVTEFDLRLT